MSRKRWIAQGMVRSIAVFSTLLVGLTVRADNPVYLTLRTPANHAPHQPSYGYYPGVEYDVRTQSYSYGAFGARPRQHWTRHFGYYRNYTQWSAK